MDIGASQDMSLKVLDIFGNEVSNAPTLWESDDQAGSIDANGVFTAGTKSGSFRQGNRVNVVQGDTSLSETFEIFIRPDPLVSIKVDPSQTMRPRVAAQKGGTVTAGIAGGLNGLCEPQGWRRRGGLVNRFRASVQHSGQLSGA